MDLRPEVLLPYVAPLLKSSLRILIILIAAWFLLRALKGLASLVERRVTHTMSARPADAAETTKRVKTLGGLFRRTMSVLVGTICGVMILKEAGFDIQPILASAGILGLAVGFGAQNLVRDVISGVFILFENQMREGDVVTINGTGGAVEQINLRTTVLRSLDGAIHVFPNGAIQSLSNLTHDFSYYVINMGVAYKEDVDRVIGLMRGEAERLRREPDFGPVMLEPIEIMGLDKFGDSAIVIQARLKTIPGKQWSVGREWNRRIKIRFDAEGVEIPFPKMSLDVPEPLLAASRQANEINSNRMEAPKPEGH